MGMNYKRPMTEYYKKKLTEGLYFQDYVVELLYEIGLPIISYSSKEFQQLIGENKAGIEIKYDQKFRNTGNLYIEIAEKSNPNNLNFVPSGIYRNDNTWLYIIGDEKTIFIFSKKLLVQLHKTKKYKEVQIETSKGYLLPLQDADKYSAKIINNEAKI